MVSAMVSCSLGWGRSQGGTSIEAEPGLYEPCRTCSCIPLDRPPTADLPLQPASLPSNGSLHLRGEARLVWVVQAVRRQQARPQLRLLQVGQLLQQVALQLQV